MVDPTLTPCSISAVSMILHGGLGDEGFVCM